jgi:apolipoprotein N-acyltransferase
VKAGVSLACGALLFLSCASFDIWPLTWFALVPLFFVILDGETERPAVYGFLCGLVANAGGFYWIVGFLERFGHLPSVASVPIFLLLVSYQAITFMLFAWIVRRLRDHSKVGGLTFLAPVVYVAVEMVVPYVFPWYLAITQAWVPAVTQIADLTGPLGVSFLIVLVNGALYDAIAALRDKSPLPRRRLAAALAVVVAALAYGQVRIHQVRARRDAAPKLKVGVVQANVGIHEKWRPQLGVEQLQLHQRLSADLEARGAGLILWPESSYPFLFLRDQSHDWPETDGRKAQRGFHTPLLFGSLTLGGEARYPFNSALLLDESGDVRGLFDKNILMVFGEYIPFYEQIKWIKKWIPEASNWARGTDVEVFPLVLPSGTAKLGPMICYEDIFPSFGRRIAKKEPNLLINITNDAWFGDTSEPWEHLALAVYRAIELRVDLVRAVNTGVSAFVDSTGKLYTHGPAVDPGEAHDAKPITLLDEVAIQQPFLLYATLGEWFGGLCMVLLALLGLRARARAGRPVAWRLVAVGAAALLATMCIGLVANGGGKRLMLGLALLAHRNLPHGIETSACQTGIRLIPGGVLGCVIAGALITRVARRRAPLEVALAMLAVFVVPALAVGTLEGEQAGLVMCALAAIGLGNLGALLIPKRYFATAT